MRRAVSSAEDTKETSDAVLNLIPYATYVPSNHGCALPHRFSTRQPKAFTISDQYFYA